MARESPSVSSDEESRQEINLTIASTNGRWGSADDDRASLLRVFITPIHWQWINTTLAGVCAVGVVSCAVTKATDSLGDLPSTTLTHGYPPIR
jgi:hypothetical protein